MLAAEDLSEREEFVSFSPYHLPSQHSHNGSNQLETGVCYKIKQHQTLTYPPGGERSHRPNDSS